ncbi:MAG: hypothetical protein JNJ73_12905 [Hyphomonadaceae bacterium]|nr:hypothetical protein [Hyphomonadaceae bacterium]
MTEFDTHLKAAFAEIEDPADDGFAAGVSQKVSRRESRAKAVGLIRVGAFAMAGGALALAVISIAQAVGPGMVAQFGLDMTTAYGEVSKGAATAASLQAALGGMLTPILLAAAAGIGGLAATRAASE